VRNRAAAAAAAVSRGLLGDDPLSRAAPKG
jgi:hypothetical protein